MTLQVGPPANRHLGVRLCGVTNQWGWAKVQPGHWGQTDSLLLMNCDVCLLLQEWACACGCLPYLRCPSDESVWLCPCVVKQMESVSAGTVSPCEQLNELVAGSQSRSPATSEVTPWRRVQTVRSARLHLTHTRQDAHTHLVERSQWLGHSFSR